MTKYYATHGPFNIKYVEIRCRIFLKKNFTLEGFFVVRNVIAVQVFDDGRWILHLCSYTYSTLVYKLLFIKRSCYAIVNVISLILNTE